jgi:hypothetical protein
MISRFRAAAVAVAMFACAGAALLGGPAQALESGSVVPGISSLDHGSATLGGDALGLNTAGSPAVGLSLDALVDNEGGVDTGDAEQDCLANAVYFEARGEPLRGQLAVAEVVMNRAASGRFPASLCAVIVQPAQFSFVRHGHIPQADHASQAWRRAVGVARVAVERMAPRLLPAGCLWYHADYVSPSWGHRLAETTRIGQHIFYS